MGRDGVSPPGALGLRADVRGTIRWLVGLTEKHVRTWVQRFLKDRLDGLRDRPGRGRKPVFSPRGGEARRQERL
jgi:hypothetical protein